MQYIRSIVFIVFGCFFVSACSTNPVAKPDGDAQVAKKFLRNVGVGQLAMTSFKKSMEKEASDNPGLAEIYKKVFSDVKEEDFISLAAGVYSRHLSDEDLIELGNVSESPTIKRFFKVVFDRVSNEQPVDNSIFKQFNSNEIMEIMKFSASDSFTRMTGALPVINEELAQAGADFGKELFRSYMKAH